jgi:hypothetical protein
MISEALPGVTVEQRWVPEDDIPTVFEESDVIVLPYREASQSGILVSALAHGVPVVATPVGGLREQLAPAATGSALAEALATLLSDPGLYARCSAGALAAAAGPYHTSRSAEASLAAAYAVRRLHRAEPSAGRRLRLVDSLRRLPALDLPHNSISIARRDPVPGRSWRRVTTTCALAGRSGPDHRRPWLWRLRVPPQRVLPWPLRRCAHRAPRPARRLQRFDVIWKGFTTRIHARACVQLSKIVSAASCTPARKFLASLS